MQNIITKQIDIFLAQQISIITVLINDHSKLLKQKTKKT